MLYLCMSVDVPVCSINMHGGGMRVLAAAKWSMHVDPAYVHSGLTLESVASSQHVSCGLPGGVTGSGNWWQRALCSNRHARYLLMHRCLHCKTEGDCPISGTAHLREQHL